jgi:hypothetical protein
MLDILTKLPEPRETIAGDAYFMANGDPPAEAAPFVERRQ